MAMAIAEPDPEKRGGDRGNQYQKQVASFTNKLATENEVHKTMLSRARTILREFGADSEQVAFVTQGGSLGDSHHGSRLQVAQRVARAGERAD